jgi:hypothetical protein
MNLEMESNVNFNTIFKKKIKSLDLEFKNGF